jgi:hypothetical protein
MLPLGRLTNAESSFYENRRRVETSATASRHALNTAPIHKVEQIESPIGSSAVASSGKLAAARCEKPKPRAHLEDEAPIVTELTLARRGLCYDPFGLGISMSTRHNCPETVTDVRLSVVADTAANLTAQLSELNELLERVRKAQLSVRRSRRKSVEKEHAFRKKRSPKSDRGK